MGESLVMKRKLCIAIHDVAPATWPQCERLLDLLERIGHAPVTLAIVPDFHGRGRIDRAPWFVRRIDDCIKGGAEVALHGFRHLDDGAPPSSLRGWINRHVLTAGEGEFASLPVAEARLRIHCGKAMFEHCGWQAAGFIPPAWLAGDGTLEALRESSLVYVSSHLTLQRLADGADIEAPCITVSARSAWRRVASKVWLNAIEQATASAPLLRIALHPIDAQHADITQRWRELVTRQLENRTAVTKLQAVSERT